jgi:peroxin-5
MSFLGGPECSTAGNPLTQFSKHLQDDKSLQRDRLASGRTGQSFESMRTQGPAGQSDQVGRLASSIEGFANAGQMMKEFLRQPSLAGPGPHNPFAMEQMRRDLPNYAGGAQRTSSPAWAVEYQAADPAVQNRTLPRGFDAAEFQKFQQPDPQVAAPMNAANGLQRPMGSMYGGMGGGMGMGMGMMNSMYRSPMGVQQSPAIDTSQDKGKGKVVELDEQNWEEQFAEIDAAGRQEDLDTEANAAIERELNEVDRSVASETLEGDFESIWRGLEAERAANRQLNDDTDFDIAGHMGDFDPWENFDAIGMHGGFGRDPPVEEYHFEKDNIFSNVGDPFSEGMKIMEEGGNLSLAALAFEAAVQKDPQHVAAWNMLGSAQAQNEKESPAIRALEQAMKLDPYNVEALMGLAVSYTNEGYDATAYRTLERWLSVRYPQILKPEDVSNPADIGFTDRHALHERTTLLFIKAAQLSPNGASMDPDVQVGLGVLFYGSESYSKAVDCFSAALESSETGTTNQRQQVHLLWNRLGATLANSGRSEEAIAAYERALAANPNFVRARYNLGVSCINIGCLEEAAQHLLGALAMHAVVQREGKERVREVVAGGGSNGVNEADLERMISANQSTNLYETLRRVFTQMDRRDLAERVVPGMDVDVFRSEFDF